MRLIKNNDNPINEDKIIDSIRSIGIDVISEAKRGNLGVTLGAASIFYTMYANFLKFDQDNPNFYNRDRFVINSHNYGVLLYTCLFLAGFDVELEDLKNYAKENAKLKINPEHLKSGGVDITPSVAGNSFATAVGIAMGEVHAANLVNDNDDLIDFNTYVIASSEDLMEGISYEAASLAGTLKLNKLIVLYDSNDTTKDGKTTLTFTENIRETYEAMDWNTILVNDGDNLTLLNKAISDAKKSNKPTLIEVKTTIGKYSENQGVSLAHHDIPTKDEITNIKNKLNMRDIAFTVSNDVMEDFQYLIAERNSNIVNEFNDKLEEMDSDKKKILDSLMLQNKRISPNGLDFAAGSDNESLNEASEKILNAFRNKNPQLFGGSADSFLSSKNYLERFGNFSSDNYLGTNIYFGKRENAMATILNGLSLVGFRPYGATSLLYSDYMKSGIRMAANMNLANIYIFTTPTLEDITKLDSLVPIEELSSLRNIPNTEVYKPADANEVLGCYKAIMQKESGPSVLMLTNAKLKVLENTSINDVNRGGYVIQKEKIHLDGILISCGEELHKTIEVANNLFSKGIDLRVVSMPNLQKFLKQDKEYIDEVLPVEARKIVLELSNDTYWNKLIFNNKNIIRQDLFISDEDSLYTEKYIFNINDLEEKIEELLK